MNVSYEDLLKDVYNNGVFRPDRTGTGTYSVFGRQIRYDLSKGFPLITTKYVPMKPIKGELLWFLDGDNRVSTLKEQDIKIWNQWELEDGTIGPLYGHQWRSWRNSDGTTTDQIFNLIEGLIEDPYSRRHVVSAWNVSDLGKMALAPCHTLFQFHVSGKKLSCQLYQRSADMFLGVPFNIASYSLLTHMVAQQVGLDVGEFVWTGGDCHIYDNHTYQVSEQLSRSPYPLPTLELKKAESIFDYKMEDIEVVGYRSHPVLRASVSV